MKTVTLKKIDIDTLMGTERPSWGSVHVEIDGRPVTLRLDQEQIDRIVPLGAAIATEIMAELYGEPAAS